MRMEKGLAVGGWALAKPISMLAVLALATVIVGTSKVLAQERDHPLIQPFAGSIVESQEVVELDEQKLVIGKVREDRTVRTEKIEGKITRLNYRDQDNRSSLERMRSYEKALKQDGFEIVYACSKELCGPDLFIESIGFFPPERYLTAFKKRDIGNVWIALLVDAGPWTKFRIVEEEPAAVDPGPVAAPAVVAPANFNPRQIQYRTVKLGEGVFFKLNDYVAATSFRNHPTTRHFFGANFRQSFLTADAQYTEEVQETEDRVVVTRTLVLNMKDPCAPGIEAAGYSLCFRPKSELATGQRAASYPDRVQLDQRQTLRDLKGTYDVKTKEYLAGVRAKIAQRLKSQPQDLAAAKVKGYLDMNDDELLDQLLNQASNAKTKKIIHTSVVPFVAYEFGKLPEMDVFDLRRPLPSVNRFLFKPTNRVALGANVPDVSNAPRFPARPVIAALAPERGRNGETITITGTHLDGVTSVKFVDGPSELPLKILSRSADRIVAEIYGWGGEKKIRLGWAAGSVDSSQGFVIYFDPLVGRAPDLGTGEGYTYVFDNVRNLDAKYLTGFTFSKHFGDIYYIHFADETEFTDAYFANFMWRLSAGFGLRWPFEVNATSAINMVYGPGNPGSPINYPVADSSQLCSGISIEGAGANRNAHFCAQAAVVKIHAKGPREISDFHFNAEFYRATGLPEDKIFRGKEFVFELGMTCRFYASIPGPNIGPFNCPGGMKFEPFAEQSQFSPQLGPDNKEFINLELTGRNLGLALELGIGYVGFNPGVSVGGRDGKFKLDVTPHRSQVDVPSVEFASFDSDRTINVVERASIPNEYGASGGYWGVDFSNPAYRVTATLTPTMSVDIGVGIGPFGWAFNTGRFSVDELSVDIASGQFERHEGTIGRYEMREIGMRKLVAPRPQ